MAKAKKAYNEQKLKKKHTKNPLISGKKPFGENTDEFR